MASGDSSPPDPLGTAPRCIGVQEAKTQLSARLARASAGEPIKLTRHGQP